MNVSVNKPVIAGVLIAVVAGYFIWTNLLFPRQPVQAKMATKTGGESESWMTRSLDPIPADMKTDKNKPDAEIKVVEKKAIIPGSKGEMYYQECIDGAQSTKILGSVLLLHGMKFASKTWVDLGTVQQLAKFGYRVIAVDLPGGFDISKSKDVKIEVSNEQFIQNLVKELKLEHSVIVSPSLSGQFAIPLLVSHPEVFRGFVPVAPVGTEKYKAADYQKIQVPTLIVYGEKDTSLGRTSLANLRNLPNHRVVMLEDANHPAYLDQPDKWHQSLYNFLKYIPK
ncbi:putative protein-lysine deacylase ABHD14B isoform X2 [Glandiceps talaboti]